MSDPSQRYHLEYRCTSLPRADQLREVLAGNDIHAGLTRRKSYYIVYIKDSGDIALLLQLMGASVSFMATENARIYKEMRNKVNRRVNCETANIGKTVVSAVRQLEDIRLLRGQGILESLPEPLRQAADLREENPGASLAELGKLADPPVGRSGMNHRIRKLSELADKAREAGTETKSSGPADKAREAGEETM
jgi:DNA-binding protein WhiA